MNKDEISLIVKNQKEFFESGKTLPVSTRIKYLKKLKEVLAAKEADISEAIKADLGKSSFESYMCETGLALSEISYMLKHIKSFSAEKTVVTPLPQFASRSYVKPSPYGTVLIMSPWNYPVLLTVDPLADAIAAGNTAILKPSAYSPKTSLLLKEIISAVFPEEYVAVVLGGREENSCLLDEKFDYIFFTGSKNVGRTVLAKAAPHLTPVTLELGGKSPCIVDKTADLKLAAKRIVFGKFLNCGQTCVAPDYVYCEKAVAKELIALLIKETGVQYKNALEDREYGNIVNEKHFDRILGLIDKSKTVYGGGFDRESLKIEPTIMEKVTFDDPVMQEEIFGPILPVIEYDSVGEVIKTVNSYDKPLALYIFSSDKKNIKRVTSQCSFGGGCVNDTIIHLATSNMGFGGVGESGMGAYHGKAGFDTFSHKKSIVDKKIWIDLPIRYRPYKKFYGKLLHMFLG